MFKGDKREMNCFSFLKPPKNKDIYNQNNSNFYKKVLIRY